MMIDKVDVFVAGVQKSGTTALFRYMADHPGLLTGAAKELHFFDDEDRNWASEDFADYHEYFEARDDRAAPRLACDVTPIYAFWPTAMARIRAYNPDARIILIHRDPIERAYSHWRMETTRGDETLSFSEAIRSGRDRLEGIDPLDLRHRVYTYVERGFYARQLKHVLEHFPAEHVLLLTSGMLAAEPLSTMNRIAGFLNIVPFRDIVPRLEHVGSKALPPPTLRDIDYLRRLFREDTMRFQQMSGLLLEDWLTLNEAISIPA